MRKVLLARPSSLIVNDMRRLITSTGCEPVPLDSISEISSFEENEVAGIVISTALSSKVKEKYGEVIQKTVSVFPDKPIFLASYSNVRSTKIIGVQRLKESAIDRELISLDEAESTEFLNEKHILILTQKEISDDMRFTKISTLVQKLLSGVNA